MQEYAALSHVDRLVTDFFQEAQGLAEQTTSAGSNYFNNTVYDTRSAAGFVKHGFVLSLYFLMMR